MKISSLQIQEFMTFFSGSRHNYGEFTYPTSGGTAKKKVAGKALTVVNKLLTIEEYKAHLEGDKGLGIIPIQEGNVCTFAVIDVDEYSSSLSPYVEAIDRGGFPLVPFRSKSGGLHIYLFLKEPTLVTEVMDIMRKFSFLLSIDNLMRVRAKRSVEIFPKQATLKDGEQGNWINLPYYDALKTNSPALRKGKELTINEALVYIKKKQTTLRDVHLFLKGLAFSDAPPCLQNLFYLNPLAEGSGRNNYMFSFGVYLKKKDEDNMEQNLLEVNASMMEPLPESEMDKIIGSLKRKDYMYKCRDIPCVDFCNKKECKKRDYGIGKDEGYFSSVECGQLYQYKMVQPYYEWEVRLSGQEETKLLRFRSEDEIIKQDAFLRLCMRELYELPSKLKQSEWTRKINEALKEIKIVGVDTDDDTSPLSLLRMLIVEFITGRSMAESKAQMQSGRVFYDHTKKEYLFRVNFLNEYLFVTKKVHTIAPHELHGILREMGCSSRVVKVSPSQTMRVSAIHRDSVSKYENNYQINPDFSELVKEEF